MDEMNVTSCRKPFETSLAECDLHPLRATGIDVLQVNLGTLCNQQCRHCHVGAGPDRREMMDRRTVRACLDALARTTIPVLNLVHNPLGPWLPPPQASLEETYRRELQARYGVVFHRLLTITNMPIHRFLVELVRNGQYDAYMDMLVGAFRLRIAGARGWLRFIQGMANLRARCLQMPYGDQAIFLRREAFETSGRFVELPIMEDYELVRRLRRHGRIAIADAEVVTSARRWRVLGPWRTTWINQKIVLCYHLGVSPQRLARWYRRDADPRR